MRSPNQAEILLLDSDDQRRLELVERLKAAGFTVLQAASVPDAVDLLARTGPEATIIDVDQLSSFQDSWIPTGDPPPLYLLGLPQPGHRIDHLSAVIPLDRLDLLDSLLVGLRQRMSLRSQRQDLERGLVELAHLAIDLGRTARSLPDDEILRRSLKQVLAMAQARFTTQNTDIAGLLFARQPGSPLSLRATIGVEEDRDLQSQYLSLASDSIRQETVIRDSEGALAIPLPTLQFQNGALVILGLGQADISSFQRLMITAAAEVSLARDANSLYHLAMIDGLTAIYNHSYGQSRVIEELRRISRSGLSITLGIVDLDHFKEINDRHGHIAGDHCLNRAAQALRRALRSTDILYRSGGEEFAIVLPGSGPQQAELMGSKLCDALRHLEIEFNGVPIPVTGSIGLASLPAVALAGRYTAGTGWTDLAHQLLELADRAMYEAKKKGRDRFERAGRNGDVSAYPQIAALLQSMS